MHKSAYINAQKFYDQYCSNNIENKKVLDIGSWDGGNGCLKPIFKTSEYIGLDVQIGPNVDVVGSSHDIPFNNDYFDVVVSSSCFEHDEFFWVAFLEMCRVLKNDGYMYICAPSSGPYHPEKCPSDSWRFYPDSWRSLSRWAKLNQYNVILIDSYIDCVHYHPDEKWDDSVGIFKKESI